MTDIFEQLCEHVARSRIKYGEYTSSHEALGVICEEYHELIGAIQSNRPDSIAREALDLAAAALKLAQDCGDEKFKARSV